MMVFIIHISTGICTVQINSNLQTNDKNKNNPICGTRAVPNIKEILLKFSGFYNFSSVIMGENIFPLQIHNFLRKIQHTLYDLQKGRINVFSPQLSHI